MTLPIGVDAVDVKIIDFIISIFETSKLSGARSYGTVTYVKTDKGQLSYGKHQASLTSGRLYLLLQRYIDNFGKYAGRLMPFINAIKLQEPWVNTSEALYDVLSEAGSDEIMVKTQDIFFEDFYLTPAILQLNALNTPVEIRDLALAIIYDSYIHGSWRIIKEKVKAAVGSKEWYKEYCIRRLNWLSNSSNLLLRKTIYRPNTFLKLIEDDNWELNLPITIRGVTISNSDLNIKPKDIKQSAMDEANITATDLHLPMLFLTRPATINAYVTFLQKNLSYYNDGQTPIIAMKKAIVSGKFGLRNVYYDGIFGIGTEMKVKKFQKGLGLKADGIVGEKTWDALLDETGLKFQD